MANKKQEYLKKKQAIIDDAREQTRKLVKPSVYRGTESDVLVAEVWESAQEQIRQLRIEYNQPLWEDTRR